MMVENSLLWTLAAVYRRVQQSQSHHHYPADFDFELAWIHSRQTREIGGKGGA